MSWPETMAMTGHHSVATVMGYFRAESALRSKVSRLVGEGKPMLKHARGPHYLVGAIHGATISALPLDPFFALASPCKNEDRVA